MTDLTNKTVTTLVADSGNGVQDWAARHGNHGTPDPGHGGWGRTDSADYGPAPTLTGLSPNTVAASAGPTTVTATGTNFTADSTIEVDGVAVPTTFVSATSLTTSYDPTTAGAKQFTVVNEGGATTAAVAFTVT